MSKQPELNETFKHYGNDGIAINLGVTVIVMVVIVIVGGLKLTTLIGVFIAGCIGLFVVALSYLLTGGKIVLTDDAIIQQALHLGTKKFFYNDIYYVRDRELTLYTQKDVMRIGRTIDDYERFYYLLRERVPITAFNDHLNLPWKLRMPAIGFGNGMREIFFTDDEIIICQYDQETIWPVSQIERIYMEGGFSRRGSYIFDTIIKIKSGPRIIITQHQLYDLKFTPEHFVANLHRLYPHTAPSEGNAFPHIDWLIEQGHKNVDVGNVAGAIKLYEQALSIDRYQWLVWQQLGMCHLQQGNYQESADAFREAITLNIEDAESFYNGAIAYSQVDDKLKTRVYLNEALTLRPEMKAQAQKNPLLQNYF